MSQHDLVVDNASGITVRLDINSALQALGTLQLGTTAPAPTYPCQLWADLSTGLLKMRNTANSAWVPFGQLDIASAGGLPAGGTPGQLLVKASTTDGDAAWSATIATLNISGSLAVGGASTVAGAINANGGIVAANNVQLIVPSGQNALYYSQVAGGRQWYAGVLSDGRFVVADVTAGVSRLIIDTVGTASLSGSLSVASSIVASGNGIAINNPVGSAHPFAGQSGGSTRWQILLGGGGAEPGSNVGADFYIQRYSDAGGFLNNPVAIARNSGVTTFSAAIVNGPSDRTLKQDIAPLEGSLAKVIQLQGVSFTMIADDTKRRQIGLIAQDVAPVVPEVIQEYRPDPETAPKLALDYPKLTALLIEALKELSAKVATLEARLPPALAA